MTEVTNGGAAASEASLWNAQKAVAEGALDFAITFLGCRSQGATLGSTKRARLLTIFRAVSWVETRHGTAGANQPVRDPFQCGNPADTWWRALTGQLRDGDRFIRGPGLTNLWAREVAEEAETKSGFPADARMANFGNKNNGHNDSGFKPAHSYVWGIIFAIHKTNTTAGDKSYDCGDLARDRLIEGAVAYNGSGDPKYRTKIEAALDDIGGLSIIPHLVEPSMDAMITAPHLVAALVAASRSDDHPCPVSRSAVTFDPRTGRILKVEIEFYCA